ncbi:SSI family serine proteinase inhibitor [Streptomyces sp. NPDC056244]|uniref:SSI family serine proteinase inhibitor n=1 Tax=Streptomyces sp. NPDC056244 TaxID=3345762 RepID=UPI0035D9CEAC
MSRRPVLAAAVSLAAAAAVLGVLAPPALSHDAPVVPLPPLEAGANQAAPHEPAELTVGVAHSGVAGGDGTYKLTCGPAGGTHPRARAACDRLAELAGAGQDPFAPVAAGAMCTMQHGGDATARITGTWRGHRVDATFSRKNGCEIARWRTLEPVLPNAGR